MKRAKGEKKNRFALSLMFSIATFAILLISLFAGGITVYILAHFEVIHGISADVSERGVLILVLFMAFISIVVGMVISFFVMKLPLKPINRTITQMNRLATGDYSARLHFGKPLGSHPSVAEAAESFNKMASELENTEMLRADFINNFSHEFKTPIVSIAGFAKLLKRGNLTEAQKGEYIDIIEEESIRLAAMATNVLDLTKIENQTILTDISRYNLSEQIRSSVLLLEEKWTKKSLDLELEFDEYSIEANEELLKQVWINLLDNAIKFSPQSGLVKVSIAEGKNTLQVSVSNHGDDISEENQKKIFNKFYQADESHAAEGNGIGLAIVRRVTQLHGGDVSVKSGNGIVTFTVTLPK